ncbi:MAG: sulfatase [Planctomycetota bacterium]
MSPNRSSTSSPRWRAWIAYALLFAAVLVALRASALFYMFRTYRGDALDLTLARIAFTLPTAMTFALACAACGTAAVAIAAKRGALVRGLAIVLTAALALGVLTGWPVDIPYHIPDARNARGREALERLALGALGIGVVWMVGATRVARARGLAHALGSRAGIGSLLAITGLVPLGFYVFAVHVGPVRSVREPVRELVFDATGWTATERHPAREPHVGVLTPTADYRVDGGDRPALILPPPASVEFRVRDEDGACVLRTASGVQNGVRLRLDDQRRSIAFEFEVLVNGRQAARELVTIERDAPESQFAWRDLGGESGVPLRPGDVVTLRTRLVSPELPLDRMPVLPLGFSRPMLDRTVERTRQRASPENPNVVLIVMDTLRADRLSCYGYPLATTPHLDALAARGLLYEQAYATSSWTWPSTASILTGLLPQAHGVTDDDSCYLSSGLETLAEVLAQRGYTTAAFTCNPLIVANKNFDQGFETFDDSIRDFRKSDLVLPSILNWMQMYEDWRFFLYLHLVDPHAPHRPRDVDRDLVGGRAPPGFPDNAISFYERKLWRGEGHTADGTPHLDGAVPRAHQEWLPKSYTASVAVSDHYVGEILAQLDALGLRENTIIAFTSDHGEELFDHDLLAHGQSLYEELVRSPLILAGPGIASGTRSRSVVSNRHLAPTLARVGGGRFERLPSFVDLARADAPSETVFFSTRHGFWNGDHKRHEILGLRDGDWTLFWAPTGKPWGAAANADAGEGELRLYDLARDPLQRDDLATQELQRALALRHVLAEKTAEALSQQPAQKLGAGESTFEMLRKIGYVGDEGVFDLHTDPPPKRDE